MSYVLLKQKEICPQCRSRAVSSGGYCRNCCMRLFVKPINFQAYEDDGNTRRYWLFTKDNGWIHRDQVIEGLKPQESFVKFTNPEKNTKGVAERLAEVRQDVERKKRIISPKLNRFGYGRSKTKLAG